MALIGDPDEARLDQQAAVDHAYHEAWIEGAIAGYRDAAQQLGQIGADEILFKAWLDAGGYSVQARIQLTTAWQSGLAERKAKFEGEAQE